MAQSDEKQTQFAILRYLQDFKSTPGVSPDTCESIDVASQCLSSAFGLDTANSEQAQQLTLPDSLPSIVQAGLAALIVCDFILLLLCLCMQKPSNKQQVDGIVDIVDDFIICR